MCQVCCCHGYGMCSQIWVRFVTVIKLLTGSGVEVSKTTLIWLQIGETTKKNTFRMKKGRWGSQVWATNKHINSVERVEGGGLISDITTGWSHCRARLSTATSYQPLAFADILAVNNNNADRTSDFMHFMTFRDVRRSSSAVCGAVNWGQFSYHGLNSAAKQEENQRQKYDGVTLLLWTAIKKSLVYFESCKPLIWERKWSAHAHALFFDFLF